MKKLIGFICILLLSYIAIKPLLTSGYFPMHDDTQVARVVVMGKALQQGQFPVRWVSDLGYGYGYPIYNFYGPLPYYIGGSLYALGVDSVLATKIMFGIGMVIAPLTLFLLVSSFFGFFAAITASMLFLYAPYHAVEVYIRGSVGEYWAIAFVPLLLYGLIMVVQKKHALRGMIVGGVSLAAIVLSHTILGFVTCALLGLGLLVYWTALMMQKKITKISLIRPGMVVLLGLGLSAFFWLPAIFELSATSVAQMVMNANTTFFDHFVCVGQLWNSPWGFAGSAPGCIDGMSFKFGKVQVIAFVISVIAWLLFQKKQDMKRKNVFMIFAMVGLLASVFLMLEISSPLWRLIPLTSFIQYPWRFLTFGMMCIAICGAYIISAPRMPIVRIGLAIGLITLTIGVNAKIFVPQYTYTRDTNAFETTEELRFIKSKISDEYLPVGIVKPQTAADIVKTAIQGEGVFRVKTLKEKDTFLYIELESTVAQTISIKKAWFPGWKISVNGKQVTPIVKQGVPSVNIPSGMSIIQMQFIDTPVRILGNIVSIITVLVIGALYAYRKKTNA